MVRSKDWLHLKSPQSAQNKVHFVLENFQLFHLLVSDPEQASVPLIPDVEPVPGRPSI
jgi:hypothetical protein